MTRPFSRSLRLSDHHESKNSKWSWAAYTLLFAASLSAHAQRNLSTSNENQPDRNHTQGVHGSIDFEIEGRNDGGVHLNYVAGEAPKTPEEQAAFDQQAKIISDAIGAPLQEVEFSDALETRVTTDGSRSRRWQSIHGVPITPRTKADRSAGVLWGTIQGTTTAAVFYASVDPLFATTATLWSFLIGYTFNAYHITLDDLFLKGLTSIERQLTKHYYAYSFHDAELAQVHREEKLRWAKKQAKNGTQAIYYTRLLLFDFGVTHLGNFVGGRQKTFLQTTIDISVLLGLQNLNSMQRNNLLRENRGLRHAYQLMTKPLISLARALQDSNKTAQVWSIASYPITQSLLWSIGLYVALITTNTVVPDFTLKAVKTTNDGIRRVGEKLIAVGNRFGGRLSRLFAEVAEHDIEWSQLPKDEQLLKAQEYARKISGGITDLGGRLASFGVVGTLETKPRSCKDVVDTERTDQFPGEVDLP